jgi:hypothetical protein
MKYPKGRQVKIRPEYLVSPTKNTNSRKTYGPLSGECNTVPQEFCVGLVAPKK